MWSTCIPFCGNINIYFIYDIKFFQALDLNNYLHTQDKLISHIYNIDFITCIWKTSSKVQSKTTSK